MGVLNPSRWEAFQFTPLREGRRQWRCKQWLTLYFNSRPSARGDRKIKTIDDPNDLFQFTPLREGRHEYEKTIFETQLISIHAPPRGATTAEEVAEMDFTEFQFTPLREGRHPAVYARLPMLPISIHAPPRGATLCF